jgi:hypothetical protein
MNAHVQPGRWDSPWYRVQVDGFEIAFLLESEEEIDEVDNVDVIVRLGDGTTWTATVFTLSEVQRLMDRWSSTGEALAGRYFWCWDGLIVREPGVTAIVDVISGLVASGDVRYIFKPGDEDEDEPAAAAELGS